MTRVALVTGAARGIGLGVAERFLADGWRVLGLDRDGEALAETQGFERIHADVATAAGRDAALDAVQIAGRLDALINNAGVADFAPLLEVTAENWDATLATNLSAPFHLVNLLAPLMAPGGAVVNIGSISGLRASTLRAAYGTSKAALAHLTRQQAVELGERGLRVNMVAPGPVETAMAAKVHTPAIRAAYADAIPLNRYGAVEEIAGAVAFLCGPDAGYVTGQCLAVDGGFEAAGVGLPALRAE